MLSHLTISTRPMLGFGAAMLHSGQIMARGAEDLRRLENGALTTAGADRRLATKAA